jgi:hypothetical protein
MELFVPSILILLLAGILIFGIFPNVSPFLLAIITIILLVITGYHHQVLFAGEYAQSTWQNSVYNASVPFLVAIVVIFMVGYLLNFLTGGAKTIKLPLPSSAAPAISKNFTTTQRQALESLIRNP